MTTAAQSRQALRLLTGTAVTASWRVLHSLTGTPEARRADLLDAVPAIIGHYSAAIETYEGWRAALR